MRHDAARSARPRLLRDFARVAFARRRALALATVGLAAVAAFTEGVGLVILVPLMAVVGLDVAEGGIGRFASAVAAAFDAVGLQPSLGVLLVLFVLVAAARAALVGAQNALAVRFVWDLTSDLREELYRAVLLADWRFLTRRRSSDFVHVMTAEVERVGVGVGNLLQLIAQAVVVAVYAALAFRVSPLTTSIVLLCGAVLLVLPRASLRAVRRYGADASETNASLYGAAIEHLSGVKLIKSVDAYARSSGHFSRLVRDVADVEVAAARGHATTDFVSTIGAAAVLAIMVFVSVSTGLSAASLLLLVLLFSRFAPRLSALLSTYLRFLHLSPAVETVLRMRDDCLRHAEPTPSHQVAVTLRDAIRFEQVSFAYEDEAGFAVHDVDLVIEAGKTTSVVGPSGSGKSTVADLVMGLVYPDRGRILVDGMPLGPETIRSWRAQIGYVAQDAFLFHDTIRANLLWANPGASDAQLRRALSHAAAAEFVEAMPNGLDTVIGDRGVRLSGGERQRVALARALVAEPALLILDEATSALDSENERRIQTAIDGLHGTTTILVITHRLNSIRHADVIYVLDRGAPTESGSWDDLVSRPTGRLRTLSEAQNIQP